jgi:hypothetical protein
MKELLFEKIIRQLVPEDILVSFDIVEVDDEKPEELIITLVEKEIMKPDRLDELILNGYLKEIELTHFPSNGRKCFLRLKHDADGKLKMKNHPEHIITTTMTSLFQALK